MTDPTSSSAKAVAARPSACPGLLRIVPARDGGICRIKLPGGVLRAAQAAVMANVAQQHAAGMIEVTNRANLQVRGVRAGHEAALIAALVDAGLGPTARVPASPDSDALSATATAAAAADDVRNLMISPSAGRDPQMRFDTRELAAQILVLLQTEARFAELSPKFAVLLDGGERLAMTGHPHDVWFAALADANGLTRFGFGLAGCPPVRSDEAGMSPALAGVPPSQVPALTRALLHAFLDLAAPEHTRMRHLLAAYSAETVLQRAQTYLDFPLAREPALAAWRRDPADASLRFGARPQRDAQMWHVGGQPPLGRLEAATLHALAAVAEQAGNGTLHMTPWQSVLLTDVDSDALPYVLARFNALGLACDGTEPLARLIACTGSSGCVKGLADTKTDALRLAAILPTHAEQVHLSGCLRSCAAAHRVPYTLLAVAAGHYDLYRRDDSEPGFGSCVAHHLTIEQAADALARLAPEPL